MSVMQITTPWFVLRCCYRRGVVRISNWGKGPHHVLTYLPALPFPRYIVDRDNGIPNNVLMKTLPRSTRWLIIDDERCTE
jgi:hypothetical protein